MQRTSPSRLGQRLADGVGPSPLPNHSGSTCYVDGYPGLAFFTSRGVPLSTHLTWLTAPHATVVLRPGGNAQALLTWRVNMGAAMPFNPGFVHITPPDEYAYLSAAWPGGPVLNANIAAWPLSAAPAGPFPAGTGTVASPLNGMCMTLGAGNAVVAWKCNPGASSQQWTGYSDGTLRINDRCLGVIGGRVEVAACTGAADQKWRISQVSFNDFGPIIDTGTGTALTDPGGSTINGTQLVMGPDRGDQTYPWRVSFHPYLAA